MPQRGHLRLHHLRLLVKTAMVENPARFSVIHELDVGVVRVAVIDGDPSATGAHDGDHAKQNTSVIGRIDCNPLFIAQTGGNHGAGQTFAGYTKLAVGEPRVAVNQSDPVGKGFGSFVKVVDGAHG